MANFIHQAKVRRDVVIRHLLSAKARRHRAYVHIDGEMVIKRAQDLPENGVPAEVQHCLAWDNHLDKLQVQRKQ